MVLACVLFTVMVALVKVAREELGTLEVMAWRGLTAVPLAWLLARRSGLGVTNRRLLALRITFGFGAMYCFYQAARWLTMADLVLITRLEPVLVAVVAPFFLGDLERAGRRTWLLMAAGLLGCGALLEPSLRVGSTAGLVALAAAALGCGAQVSLRGLKEESSAAVVFWFQASLCAGTFGLLLTLGGGRVPLPPASLLPHLLGIGVFATLAQLAMTRAFAIDKAPLVSAASYTSPLFAAVADLLVYAAVPGPAALVGGTVVVGSGLGLAFSAAPTPDRRATGSAPPPTG